MDAVLGPPLQVNWAGPKDEDKIWAMRPDTARLERVDGLTKVHLSPLSGG